MTTQQFPSEKKSFLLDFHSFRFFFFFSDFINISLFYESKQHEVHRQYESL